MPVLTIGDKSVTVGDEFLKLSPDQQNATVQEIAGSIGVGGNQAPQPEAAPVTANSVVRSAATGVPIVGGLMNKLDAASNAALAPLLNRFFAPEDQLAEPTFGERYAHSLRDQEGADKRFATDHPVIDTAAQLAGGIASTAPFMAAAPKAFGLTGTLPQMVRNGAISGAALSGADAATRGEDIGGAATVGGIIGGAAGPVGKGVGKVVAAIADRVKPPAAVARNLESVAGVDVPLSQSQVTQNPALSAEEQIMLRGGRGDAAQAQAQGFKDLQDERVSQARDTIAAGLDPTGQSARTAPQDAAERIASELLAQEQARQASEAGVHAGPMSPAQQAQDMARALAPDGQLRAASPIDAGEVLSDRLAAARDAAKADYRGKYAAVDAAPGEFAPGSAGGFGNDVEHGLRSAAVSLDKTNTPKALNALRVIDEHLNAVAPGEAQAAAAAAPDHTRNVADIRAKFGDGVAAAYDRQAQAAASAAEAAKPAAAPAAGSGFTMRDVEQVRKQISTLYGDARRAMLGGGSGSDLHALEHISDQFDARVEKMLADGKFSGDGPAVLKMQQEARAAFSDYKAKFAKRGPGDTIGAAVEKILGKFSDTRATPDEVVKLAYGSATSPGGQMPVQIAQRIKNIFGEKSAEFGAYKQGLFAHLTAGEPEAAADRVRAFLDGKGRLLAQTVFSPGERKSLAQFADRLRASIPAEPEKGAVASLIRKVANGEASPNELVNALFGASGKGAGSMSVPLAQKLKASLPPEAWTSVRQGMFEKLTSAGEGKIEFEAQALSQRLHEFLNESGSQLAKTLYSPQEIDLMRKLANVYKQMIPVKGTTNPSGTAPMLARMAGGLRSTLLPLLGLTHGGIPGAAMGAVLDKGVTAARNANDARKATELFYGPQARRIADPRFSTGLGLLAQGSMPSENERRRRSQ